MAAKELYFNTEARAALKRGVDQLAGLAHRRARLLSELVGGALVTITPVRVGVGHPLGGDGFHARHHVLDLGELVDDDCGGGAVDEGGVEPLCNAGHVALDCPHLVYAEHTFDDSRRW